MARREKMSKMKMPEAPMQDEMLELDELEMDDELMADEDAEMDMEDESMMDLTEVSDEDLMAELEARGFMVEQSEEDAEESDEDAEDEDEEYMAQSPYSGIFSPLVCIFVNNNTTGRITW